MKFSDFIIMIMILLLGMMSMFILQSSEEVLKSQNEFDRQLGRGLRYLYSAVRIERLFDDESAYLLFDCHAGEMQYSTSDYQIACDCKTNKCYQIKPVK